MNTNHARVLLEELQLAYGLADDQNGAAFVGRALRLIPRGTVRECLRAKDDLQQCGAFDRGFFLTPLGKRLAFATGRAIVENTGYPALPVFDEGYREGGV